MTMREHAIIAKKVINHDLGGTHVMCGWEDCERDGVELHKVRINYGKPGYPDQIVNHVFCSDRHKMYFVHSHRSYGNLPPGYRMSTI